MAATVNREASNRSMRRQLSLEHDGKTSPFPVCLLSTPPLPSPMAVGEVSSKETLELIKWRQYGREMELNIQGISNKQHVF
ncbi:hypothetical protein TNIN_362381 [Trichonephila inaurata madagascariensis]|uniref:Uncharacterized protein n=1 Tax=Trichonephila inaurata madagascariensis TaxID=2747483 RepID=A0A8X7BR08_9ARAC|nr:hypothetical protein TNIN_362381 [Trichonephila inaurata madagascariensis]